jgi:hypothetical protein
LSTPGWSAEDPLQGDLRDLSVGMRVSELPAEGYVHLACGNDGEEPGLDLASWAEFERCPADGAGLHEVAFEYDDSLQPLAAISDKWEGTQVAGHPVIPSLLIDDRASCSAFGSSPIPMCASILRRRRSCCRSG